MSKLIFNILFSATSLFGMYLICAIFPEMAFAHGQNNESSDDIWGKPNAPVLVKIQEIHKTGNIVELRGLVRSKYSQLKIEWKLPDGAELVSGELNKSVNKKPDGSFAQETIKVDIGNAKDEPIVFIGFFEQNGERMGHSRVYKWNAPADHQVTVEKVRAKMKARKAKFVP
jgi:hypothetical protein